MQIVEDVEKLDKLDLMLMGLLLVGLVCCLTACLGGC